MKKSELWWIRKSEYFESGHSNHSFGNRCRRPTEIKRLHTWTLEFYLTETWLQGLLCCGIAQSSVLDSANSKLLISRWHPALFFLNGHELWWTLVLLMDNGFVFNSLVLRRAFLNPEKVSNQNESVLLHGQHEGFISDRSVWHSCEAALQQLLLLTIMTPTVLMLIEEKCSTFIIAAPAVLHVAAHEKLHHSLFI